jgi:hypothetical protein
MFTAAFIFLGIAFSFIVFVRAMLGYIARRNDESTIRDIRLNRVGRISDIPSTMLFYGMHKRALLTMLVSLTKRQESIPELIGDSEYFHSVPRNW